MRSIIFFFILLCNACFCVGQLPEGRLYFCTGAGGVPSPLLGYVQYPDETYSVVDNVQLTDFVEKDNKLYTAGLADIVVYAISSLQPEDTLAGAYARHITAGDNYLAFTSNEAPYLNVYDLQTLSYLFSIDTSKIAEAPVDVAIWDNKVFVLLNRSVVVVDAILEDTLATKAIPSPFPFPGFNQYLVEAGADFYIAIGYATGAPRYAMMKMNKLTYEVDSVFHFTGNESYYRPVAADDKIYLFSFDSHYDIANDSLHIGPVPFGSRAIAYDSVSGAVFLDHWSVNGIGYFSDGSLSDTVTIDGPTIEQALFVPTPNDTVNAVHRPALKGVTFYPNPVKNFLHITMPGSRQVNSLTLYDLAGKIVYEELVNNYRQSFTVDVSGLRQGFYFVKVQLRDNSIALKIVK